MTPPYTIDTIDHVVIRAHLAGHGGDVGDIGTRFGAEGDGLSLYVTDPEGNVVELKAG